MQRVLLPVSIAAALWHALPLCAQQPVLHEFVPAVDPDEVSRALAAHESGESGESASAPESGTVPDAGSGGPIARPSEAPHSDNFRPDRLTALEGALDYYEAFDPAIAPFKRVMALDITRLDVDGKTPVLGLRDPRRRTVPIESPNAAAPDPRPRDRFKGAVDIDFSSGPVQRLPSVSPESRILGLNTQPALAVRVERDGADNFFLQALGEPPPGPVHVTFLTDAPRAYFGAPIPRVPLRELRKGAPKLDPSIQKRALRFAAQLGIGEQSDLRSALEALTRHFRAFTESETPPEDTGDLYLDLARGGVGLCRHRAYAFVVTAHALGIAARLVQNEAHSWVEVALPETGFLRIDLGGATHGLTAHRNLDQASYLPAQPDTLPKPEAYREAYARAAEHAPAPRNPPDPDSLTGRWLPDDALAAAQRTAAQAEPAAMSGKRDQRIPLHVNLDDRRMNALRGGRLVLTGRVLDPREQGVPGQRVEVWIRRAERHERMLLGVNVTDADGYFRAAFGVPPDLAVGDYRMFVVAQGDALHLPAMSE